MSVLPLSQYGFSLKVSVRALSPLLRVSDFRHQLFELLRSFRVPVSVHGLLDALFLLFIVSLDHLPVAIDCNPLEIVMVFESCLVRLGHMADRLKDGIGPDRVPLFVNPEPVVLDEIQNLAEENLHPCGPERSVGRGPEAMKVLFCPGPVPPEFRRQARELEDICGILKRGEVRLQAAFGTTEFCINADHSSS